MKKIHIFIRILSAFLTAVTVFAAAGCTNLEKFPVIESDDSTDTAAPHTEADTEAPTAVPETAPAPVTEPATEPATEADTEPPFVPDPPETDKTVIQSFDGGDAARAWNSIDWTGSQYGITNPVFATADESTDLEKGLKVTLSTAAACQYLSDSSAAVKEAFAKAADYTYVRLWMANHTGGSVSIGAIYETATGSAASNGDAILTYQCDGKKFDFPKNDASGMGGGANTAVSVPDGFEGWIAFPLDALTANWGAEVAKDLNTTKKISFDLRPAGYDAEGWYVLDELTLTNSPYGERRKGNGTGIMTTNEKKQQQIAEAFAKALNTDPNVQEIEAFAPTAPEYNYIKAVTYDGMDRDGKKTKVFAYIGFPAGASEENPVPAIVLVHGGGGHAYLQWIKMWNDRGYAAIAMDNTGYFPTAVNAGETEVTQGFAYGLTGIFVQDGYTHAPNNDGMASSDGKVENMWMYHAVGQTILANNILRADKRVDADKIGVTGISWGGVITSIAIGWDNRFAFAIPIYGSGYLTESRAWMGDNFAGESTQALWSAAARFDKVTMPVLWLAWNDDSCFSVNSNSMSFADTVRLNDRTRLSMLNQMMHSHSCGWNPAESMVFADSVVKGTAQMVGFASQPSGRTLDVTLTVPEGTTLRRVKLYYITAPHTYSRHEKYGYTDTFMDPEWKTKTLTVDKATGKITGEVPADAVCYYIEVSASIGKETVVTCSEFIELK